MIVVLKFKHSSHTLRLYNTSVIVTEASLMAECYSLLSFSSDFHLQPTFKGGQNHLTLPPTPQFRLVYLLKIISG